MRGVIVKKDDRLLCSFYQEAKSDPVWVKKPELIKKRSFFNCIIYRKFMDERGSIVKEQVEVVYSPGKKGKKGIRFKDFYKDHVVNKIEEVLPPGQSFTEWGFKVYKWG